MTLAYFPESISEAAEALAKGATSVAGATDLLVIDHATGREHAAVVNLLGIPDLQKFHIDERGLHIGAASTFTQIRNSALVLSNAPLLIAAAKTIGAAQIQNRATIGGNIANASPAGDSLPALLALDADLVMTSLRGRRTIAYERFHTGYRETILKRDELIERVIIPLPAPGVQIFRKVGTRAAQAISKVIVAFASDPPASGVLKNVRLAMGSIAPTPTRLHKAEALIESGPLSPALADRVAALIERTISPIDDIRSTADYRRHVAGQIVRRLLLELQ